MADDVVTDGGTDSAKMDAKVDTGTDSGKMDTGTDSGKMDAGVDAGVDAGEDAEDDADDGGAPDVKPPPMMDAGGPDGQSMCMLGIGFGTVSMNGCTSGQQWSCGNDKYEYDCACPGAMCKCSKNGQFVQNVQSPNGCPNCNFSGATVAALCGFPY